MGAGSTVWAFVHILPGAIIGRNVNVCDHCFVENEVMLGDNVVVKCGVWLWDGITVEDNVFIGPGAVFTNDRLPRSKNRDFVLERTVLRKGCSIGASATVLAGVTVGAYAMVGAGAIVAEDVPDFALVYGAKARVHGFVCECGKKLSFAANRAACGCGLRFRKTGTKVVRI